jgi:hypothetical protein
MADSASPADEVLAHSTDEGEWEEEPEEIESRPSGSQVISARLPTPLADELLSEAARRGVRPSELVRIAVESFLIARPAGVAGISGHAEGRLRLDLPEIETRNLNPVVEIPTEPPEVVAIGLLLLDD